MTCFRHFGFTRLEDVDALSIREARMLMEALSLREVDMDYRVHQAAFLNQSVKATKGKGKNARPVYKKFRDFFDYEKAVNDIRSKVRGITSGGMSNFEKVLSRKREKEKNA